MFLRNGKNEYAQSTYSRPNRFNDSSRYSTKNYHFAIFAVFASIIIAVIVFLGTMQMSTTGSATDCLVTDKDRVSNSDGASEMRVYTENCGVFVVGDNFLIGNFRSADLYGGIKIGSTYDFETRGVRIPLMSAFPNIVKATEV